ncbi:hypothetical protein CANARDRAFT_27941 [[Candida] arabinofermentans NRRL YB-2248]|uniref:Uncharacterized protein n=1 Tax=[Candida] arabinofermentans NRRL YB-2248 TaxID=983967 RepID=A0A1E4T270_9ASCO|nr:hypothetical protein CANARDRAFT_27941 [[Candida] arabinofermentans NRRL YB-2248]
MLSLIASLSLQDYLTQLDVISNDYQPSLLRLRLSGFAGSTSLACWIVLILPQLVEQWRLKSAEGIAPLFLILWSIGDILNFIGSIWAGLLPQVVLLGAWFTVADMCTLGFYYYFTYVYPKKYKIHHEGQGHDEETPLLSESVSGTTHTTITGRTKSHSSRKSSRRRSSVIEDIVLEPKEHSIFVRYIIPLSIVFLAGGIGYFCSSPATSIPDDDDNKPEKKIAMGAQICGYLSAFLYLSARLPQIHQNWKKKSCKGLSLLFFMFSTLGNITYGLSILFYRSDWDYIILNSSWLLGSLGTIAEDLVIFVQFYAYREKSDDVFHEEG